VGEAIGESSPIMAVLMLIIGVKLIGNAISDFSTGRERRRA